MPRKWWFLIVPVLFMCALLFYACSSSSSGSREARWPNLPDMTNWQKEDGVRVAEMVSTSTIVLPDGRYRIFYLLGGVGIKSAISSDGINFTEEEGVRVAASGGSYDAAVKDPDLVVEDGYWRMYFTAIGQDDKHRCMSAVSTDGSTFSIEAGVRLAYSADYDELVDVPSVVKVSANNYKMYFVYDWYGDNSIKGATSTDGLNWTVQTVTGFTDDCMDPDVFLAGDGTLVMYFAAPYYASSRAPLNIFKAVSSDGVSWEVVGRALYPTKEVEGQMVGDPDVVALPDSRYRVYYYGYSGSDTYNILSASAESF